MYINNIVGLSNKFIYGNDDTFPNNKLSPSDFFTKDNKIITNIHKRKFYDMNWYHMLRNSMALIYKLCNIKSYRRNYIDSPNHVDVPMIRDNNIELDKIIILVNLYGYYIQYIKRVVSIKKCLI